MQLVVLFTLIYVIKELYPTVCVKINPAEYYLPLKENTLIPQERLDQAVDNIKNGARKILEQEKYDLGQHEKFANGKTLCLEYSYDTCPHYWELKNDPEGNQLCVAPSNYTGFCNRQLRFDNLEQDKKAELAVTCGFQWPCLNHHDCQPDFSSPCPESFLLLEDAVECVPNPMTYSGLCMTSVNFSGLTNSAKRKWAEKCGTRWPCKTVHLDSSRRKHKPCPHGWKEDIPKKSCISSQGSFCNGEWKFLYWTEKMKDDFSSTCKVPWLFENVACAEYDLDAPCPEGWTYEKTTSRCTSDRHPDPPHAVLNTCGLRSATFGKLSRAERYSFMLQCNVEWPCISKSKECVRDWTRECPENWKIKDSYIGMCYPLVSFSSSERLDPSCYTPKVFRDYSEEERRIWASSCDAPWPCKDQTQDVSNSPEFLPEMTKDSIRSFARQRTATHKKKQNIGGPIDPKTGKLFIEAIVSKKKKDSMIHTKCTRSIQPEKITYESRPFKSQPIPQGHYGG